MNIKLLVAGTLVIAAFSTCLALPTQARGGDVNTQNIIMNNFATRQAQLGSQIDSALAAGQLSYGQASSLHAQLNGLAAAQNQGMRQGGFSPMQTQNIVNGFTNITNQLNQSISYNSQYSTYVQPTPFARYGTYENNVAYQNSLRYRRGDPNWNRNHVNAHVAPHPWHQE